MVTAATSRLEGLRGRAIDPGTATVVLLLLGVAVFLLVGCLQSTNFAQYTVQGVALGSVYGSLALALVLVYRATHVINFAQGELAMFTTYIAYELMLHGFSYWAAFAATLAIAFVLGTVLQVTIIRPVQHRSVIATVIVTVGLFVLIDGVVNWIWGGDLKSMPSPFGNGYFVVGGVAIQHLYVGMVIVVFASAVLVWALFRFTKLGLGMRAAALRPAAASLVGVRVDSMLAIGWGLAAVLGARRRPDGRALAVLPHADLHAADPRLRLRRRRPRRPREPGGSAHRRPPDRRHADPARRLRAADRPGHITSELQLPFSFVVLLLILLVKPSGLFGRREVRRV